MCLIKSQGKTELPDVQIVVRSSSKNTDIQVMRFLFWGGEVFAERGDKSVFSANVRVFLKDHKGAAKRKS